jgi:G:T-mismatch repair DNA endonuclease (very short patch repair protein)
MVRCKVYSIVEGREKLSVPKLDSLVKHYGLKKCIVTKLGFVVSQFYSCPINTHVKNEKLVASVRRNIVLAQYGFILFTHGCHASFKHENRVHDFHV